MSDDDGAPVVMAVIVGMTGPGGGTGVVGATGVVGGPVEPAAGPPISPTSKLACLRNSFNTRCCNRRPRRDTPDAYKTGGDMATVGHLIRPAVCVALTSATLVSDPPLTLTWAYPLT